MVDSTAEAQISKPRAEVIQEAKRLEESTIVTAKSHYNDAQYWRYFHYGVGIPIVLFSAAAGAAALKQFDDAGTVAGVLSLLVTVLSGLLTYVNPNEKSSVHLKAGNSYESLSTSARIFHSVTCCTDEADAVVIDTLHRLAAEKSALNAECPQPSARAFKKTRKGIADGETSYDVDVQKPKQLG